MELGKHISRICKERGISLSELARRSKVPIQTLHGWTAGRRAVQLDQLRRVAEVLKLPLYQLAYGESDPFEPMGEEILKELFSGDVRVSLHRIERKRGGHQT